MAPLQLGKTQSSFVNAACVAPFILAFFRILGYTRNIPTAIALETTKGEFAQAIALGMVLLVMALLLNGMLAFFQGRGIMSS